MTERDIFICALQKENQAERLRYLDEICAGQPELRQQVEALLRLFGEAGSFLEKPGADGCSICFGTTAGSIRPTISSTASARSAPSAVTP